MGALRGEKRICGRYPRRENSFCVMIAPETRARQTCNSEAAGVPLTAGAGGQSSDKMPAFAVNAASFLRVCSAAREPNSHNPTRWREFNSVRNKICQYLV